MVGVSGLICCRFNTWRQPLVTFGTNVLVGFEWFLVVFWVHELEVNGVVVAGCAHDLDDSAVCLRFAV